MAQISLRNIPDSLHRKIKRVQLDLEEQGKKLGLEEIYLDLVQKGLNQIEKEKPSK